MADRCLIAALNWIWEDADVAFSGGDWVATDTVKIANLLNTRPASFARTTSDDTVDTALTVTFSDDRLIDHIFFGNTNASDAGTVTVIADGDTIASGHALVPTTHSPSGGYIAFGRTSATGNVPTDERGADGVSSLLILDEAVAVTELVLQFSDTANPDGYFQIGQLWAGMSARPTIPPVAGAFTLGTVEESRRRRSLGGTLHSRRLWARKRITAVLEYQPEDEALPIWFEMVRRLGGTGPLLFSQLAPDGIATIDQSRTTILGVLEEPPVVEHQVRDMWRIALSIVEL